MDKDNWLSIDEKTGEIKLNKLPDRESPYLVNGTYMAEILCISQGFLPQLNYLKINNIFFPLLILSTKSFCV